MAKVLPLHGTALATFRFYVEIRGTIVFGIRVCLSLWILIIFSGLRMRTEHCFLYMCA